MEKDRQVAHEKKKQEKEGRYMQQGKVLKGDIEGANPKAEYLMMLSNLLNKSFFLRVSHLFKPKFLLTSSFLLFKTKQPKLGYKISLN